MMRDPTLNSALTPSSLIICKNALSVPLTSPYSEPPNRKVLPTEKLEFRISAWSEISPITARFLTLLVKLRFSAKETFLAFSIKKRSFSLEKFSCAVLLEVVPAPTLTEAEFFTTKEA